MMITEDRAKLANGGFIPELTGLRGFAALLIIVNHLILVLPALKDIVLPGGIKLSHFTLICGLAGMSLFFILSGIVIYYTYAQRILDRPVLGIKNFIVARFARLYPLYFVFIVFFFFWNLKNVPQMIAENLTSLPLFLAGLQSWVYGYINGTQVIYLQGDANISWSISTEFALYFFFVPLVFAVGRGSLRKALVLFASAFALRIAYVYAISRYACLTDWISSIFPGNGDAHLLYLTYHSPYGRIFEFVAGWAIAMMYIGRTGCGRSFKWLSVLSWICSALLLGLAVFDVFKGWSSMLISSCLMLFCFGLPCIGSCVLRSRLLMFLGDVSYSAYLLHIFFVVILQYWGTEHGKILETLAKFLLFTYVAAWISYRYFETPVRRKIRDVLK